MAMDWGAVVQGGAALGSLLTNKKQKQEQIPLETPEQTLARQRLNQFSQTGQWGDFKAGQDIGIGTGMDYGASDIEKTGLSNLQNLINTSIPDKYKLSDAAINDMLQTNPAAIEAQFNPFKTQVQRQIDESNTALKRQAGVMGNLYSTDTIRNLGDIQARGNETLATKLAELTNQAADRRLQAAAAAQQSAQSQETMAINRVTASQQYGSLLRNLNNQAVQARDAELLRRRQELQLPIGAAQTVLGSNATFGIPSVSTYASPYQGTLDALANMGAQMSYNYNY